MSTQRERDVMKAFDEGKVIERIYQKGHWSGWEVDCNPVWNWREFDYRVQEELSLGDRIKAVYGEFEVMMLTSIQGRMTFTSTSHGASLFSICAQSFIGFAGYVYDHGDNDLNVALKPTKKWRGKVIQPVAALFYKEEEK